MKQASGSKLAKILLSMFIVGAVMSTAVVLDTATAPEAAAHEGHGAAVGGGSWHPWSSDGCSWVPNWQWGVFNFTHACQHHDGCYGGHWASRYTCDVWFYNDMKASCRTGHTWWVNRATCYSIAWSYYQGVRISNYAVNAYRRWSHNIRWHPAF